MRMITLFGLKTCDTCRKARQAAESEGESVRFVDVRDTPLNDADLGRFLAAFGNDLVNRQSATWRNLSETERERPPMALLRDHPALMKRPVIDGKVLTLGWNDEVRAQHLG
jgi:arsenate reductase-like glutaredoxin family protein